jgi:hypothetical protein
MFIPIFVNVKAIDQDGYYTPDFQIYEDTLNQSMRGALSDDGWTLPQLQTAQITQIAPQMPNGTLWYDKDTDEIKAKVGGSVVVIYP